MQQFYCCDVVNGDFRSLYTFTGEFIIFWGKKEIFDPVGQLEKFSQVTEDNKEYLKTARQTCNRC